MEAAVREHIRREVDSRVRRSLPPCGSCGQVGRCADDCASLALVDGDERPAGNNTRRWTDDEIAGILRDMGGRVSRNRYTSERKRHAGGTIPAPTSLMRRFGSWEKMLDAVL